MAKPTPQAKSVSPSRSDLDQGWLGRHYQMVVAFAVGLVIAVAYGVFVERVGNGNGTVSLPPEADDLPAVVGELGTSSESAEVVIAPLARAVPLRIRIPAQSIEAVFEDPLGLNYDGTIAVPVAYDTVGWYQFGPTPGEIGPAVVLGHVDSFEGPAVFYTLGQLAPGDEVLIDRADGTTATFLVERLERHEQEGFPTAEVYGDIDHAGLRLITCSGTYDRSSLRYSHNLIVYARLVD